MLVLHADSSPADHALRADVHRLVGRLPGRPVVALVTHVFTHYGAAHPGPLLRATPEQLRALDLPAGSMRPKVEAAALLAERTAGLAAIGPLDDALGILLGTTGTIVQAARVGAAQAASGLPHPRTACTHSEKAVDPGKSRVHRLRVRAADSGPQVPGRLLLRGPVGPVRAAVDL
ncbi:amino acid kinase family protein [Kitasatospora mediocidica]|uniref:hypothetical protein n=1 Tax=Kitasatospora mediocidica TaxID=58352 RepID=UPI000561BB49|nr:hypothetical protein [Kitasatospora mediocidica]